MSTHMPHLQNSLAARRRHQGGFTLIEMMISITIGLAILAGLVGVLATNSSNSRTNDRTSELMTNGRYALNSIKQELREAGFRGYTWAEPSPPSPWAAPADATGCYEAGASASAFISNIRQGVWGSNNANPFAATCIPAARYQAGTDVLVVRRLAVVPTSGALVAGPVYFRTIYERGQLFRSAVGGGAPVPPTFTGTTQLPATFEVQTFVYYISPFTVSAAEVPLVPSLRRVALQTAGANAGTMVDELVASGIERMQVQYGRLTTAPDTQYLNTLPGSSSDSTAGAWDEVHAIRIWLLARNSTPEPGFVNNTTYAMGDTNVTPGDNFRRQLFTTVVHFRN